MRHIAIPFTIDFIAAASYGESTRSSGTVALSGLDGLAIGRPACPRRGGHP